MRRNHAFHGFGHEKGRIMIASDSLAGSEAISHSFRYNYEARHHISPNLLTSYVGLSIDDTLSPSEPFRGKIGA